MSIISLNEYKEILGGTHSQAEVETNNQFLRFRDCLGMSVCLPDWLDESLSL